jgi:hypothetical protein
MKDGTKMFRNIGGFNGSEKFCLSAGSGGDGLSVTTAGNHTGSKEKTVASSGAAITKAVSM